MRQLNEKEKSIIKYLVDAKDLEESAIIGLIDKYIEVYVVRWDDAYSRLEICGNSEIDIRGRYNALLELIFLLDYLCSNMYISIYNLSIKNGNSIHNKRYEVAEEKDDRITMIKIKEANLIKIHDTTYDESASYTVSLSSDIVYTDLGKKISLYAKSAFFVSENLRDFVKNDFKTQEQLRFEKQMKDTQDKHTQAMKAAEDTLCWTRWAFIVALLAFLFDKCS